MPFNPAMQPQIPQGTVNPWAGMAQGMENMARSIERGLELKQLERLRQQEKLEEEQKAFSKIQGALEAYGIADKKTSSMWGLKESDRVLSMELTKRQLERDRRIAAESALQQQMQKLAVQEREAKAYANARMDEWLAGNPGKPTVEEFDMAASGTRLLSLDPQGYMARKSMLYPNEVDFPAKAGKSYEIEGLPGYRGFFTSGGQLQAVQDPTDPRLPPPVARPIQGAPGWVQMPNNTVVPLEGRGSASGASSSDRALAAERVAKARETLRQLQALKDSGKTKARIDPNTGVVLAPSAWSFDESIDTLINKQKMDIARFEGTAGGAANPLANDARIKKLQEMVAAGVIDNAQARKIAEALLNE